MMTIDPASGGIATPSCPRTIALPFLSGTEPTRICPLHGGLFATATAMAPSLGSGTGTLGPAAGASHLASGLPNANPSAMASPASNSVLGPIGNFFGALFGHH
jgi:hypothetical protein